MGTERGVEDATTGVADESTIRTTWDPGHPDTITGAIVSAIADIEGVDPTELSVPLHDVLDPDALVRVLSSGSGAGHVSVSFRMAGHEVTTRDDGEIVVRRRATGTLG